MSSEVSLNWTECYPLAMSLPQNLAANLKTLRQRTGLTQQQLSKRSGLPRSTLANLETGSGNPTLSVLGALSAALQVGLDELLSAPRGLGVLYPAGSLPKEHRGQATIQSLLPDPLPGTEITRMEIPSGARIRGVPHLPGTREYLYCAQGEVDLRVGGQKFLVKAGDVCAFQGDLPHSYGNPSSVLALCTGVVVLAPMA